MRTLMNPHQVSEISLSPEAVDGIVFWAKNPGPMLDRLDEIQDYMYCFQFTLTSYGTDVECGCMEALDVGAYNTCRSGRRYCCANCSEKTAASQSALHGPDLPLLIGAVGPKDKIAPRKMASCKADQFRFDL